MNINLRWLHNDTVSPKDTLSLSSYISASRSYTFDALREMGRTINITEDGLIAEEMRVIMEQMGVHEDEVSLLGKIFFLYQVRKPP